MRHVIRLLMLVGVSLAAAACASSGAVPRPFPGASIPADSTGRSTATAASGIDVISTALMYQGIPYRNGGTDPSGFDCSGFVQWVFAQNGRTLPREVRDQYRVGTEVEREDIRPGDLVFFETVSQGASHVGIALDDERFVHAPSSRGVVRIERYTSDYWKKRYLGARRIEKPETESR